MSIIDTNSKTAVLFKDYMDICSAVDDDGDNVININEKCLLKNDKYKKQKQQNLLKIKNNLSLNENDRYYIIQNSSKNYHLSSTVNLNNNRYLYNCNNNYSYYYHYNLNQEYKKNRNLLKRNSEHNKDSDVIFNADIQNFITSSSSTLFSTSSLLSSSSSSSTSSLSMSSKIELYFLYGDSLARNGHLYEAIDIYAYIANYLLDDIIPIERLKLLSICLLNRFTINKNFYNNMNNCNNNCNCSIITSMTNNNTNSGNSGSSGTISNNNSSGNDNCNGVNNLNLNSLLTQQQQQQHQQQQIKMQQRCNAHLQQLPRQHQQKYEIDPLLCPLCEDILVSPITGLCGHTYCMRCYLNLTQCIRCGMIIQNYNNNNNNNNNNLKQDVLIKHLIDKWWPQELEAKKLKDEAIKYLNINSLDEALKYCNESLEKSPNNYKSLLLRSEVLYKLNHFQSSLADADNALKCYPASSKAHQRRALALVSLGRIEEALISKCLAVSLDLNLTCISSSIFINEVSRLLQHFFQPTQSKNEYINSSTISLSLKPSLCSTASVMKKKRRKRRRRIIDIAQNYDGDDDSVDFNVYNNFNSNLRYCDDTDSSYRGNSNCNNHYNKRRCIRKSMTLTKTETRDYTIPLSSIKIRTLLDDVQQELQRINAFEHKSNVSSQVNPDKIDVSDFDCVLCCRTLWKPIVTPCGHTYCLICLDRCMDYSSSCPLCMSLLVEQQPVQKQNYCNNNNGNGGGGSLTPIPFSLRKRSVTKFLEIAMQRFIPDWYEKRKRQEIESEPSVPIFICTTAFPYVPCPLFVYEPRYRLMVRRAIESGTRQFGIVQPPIIGNTTKSRYSDVGTMLDIRDCILLGDGCSILSTIGFKRFKILSRDEKDGYETAKVEYISDEPIPDGFISFINEMHTIVLHKAKKWFETLGNEIREEILRSFGEMPNVEDNWENCPDGPAWAWWIIAILPLNQQLKVNILATTSLEKRLRAIGKTLDYITGRFRHKSTTTSPATHQSCVVVQCESLHQSCQATECCQQSTQQSSMTTTQSDDDELHHQSSGEHHHHHTEVNTQTEYML